MAVFPLSIVVMAPLAGWLADRYSARVLCMFGGLVQASGLALMALPVIHQSTALFVVAAVICGLGFGCFQTPNNRALMGAAPRARSGAAAGLQATARMTGQILGTTATALVFGWTASGAPMVALGVTAVLASIGGILSLWRPVN